MKHKIILTVEFDDRKFGQRPDDIQAAALRGIRAQFGSDGVSGITLDRTYTSSSDPSWIKARQEIGDA